MRMKNFLKIVIHFFVSGGLAAILACLAHTQFVLHELALLDINITFSDRLHMSIQDILGLLPTYGSIVLIGFFLAFLTTWLIRKFTPLTSWHLYTLAGSVAMLAILILMENLLNLAFLAGARTSMGMLFQVIAGAIGGALFAFFRKQQISQVTP